MPGSPRRYPQTKLPPPQVYYCTALVFHRLVVRWLRNFMVNSQLSTIFKIWGSLYKNLGIFGPTQLYAVTCSTGPYYICKHMWYVIDVFGNTRWACIQKLIKFAHFYAIRFWRNLVHNSIFGTQWQPGVQIWTFLKIQDAGHPFKNRFFGHDSATDCAISAKFCAGKQFFYRISIMRQIPAFHRMYLLFSQCSLGFSKWHLSYDLQYCLQYICFCRAMLCKRGLCRHAVSVCVSITFVHSRSGSHIILVFPYQTAWWYSDGNPSNGGVECRWGRQKSQFWAYIWLQCLLLMVQQARCYQYNAA